MVICYVDDQHDGSTEINADRNTVNLAVVKPDQ